ncbi:MAG: hypothetical protein CM15mP130_1790 [Verrucomicrobiota bacterium]|nr:MAG: hypothetical protein CM15mP130_1790 [Verrucomicrobiota bacterium]
MASAQEGGTVAYQTCSETFLLFLSSNHALGLRAMRIFFINSSSHSRSLAGEAEDILKYTGLLVPLEVPSRGFYEQITDNPKTYDAIKLQRTQSSWITLRYPYNTKGCH